MAQIERYQFYTDASGYSPATVGHVRRCLAYFAKFMGGIEDVAKVSGDDLRKFIVYLRERRVWQDLGRPHAGRVRPVSINTYVRAIKSFWGGLKGRVVFRVIRLPKYRHRAFQKGFPGYTLMGK